MSNFSKFPLPDLSEYDDPAIYDLENSGFEPSGPFFLELANKCDGDVFEIGCGTGRYTIPMTEDGRLITVSGIQEYDPLPQIRTETAYHRWEKDGATITKVAPLSLRNTFPQELVYYYKKNGFEVEARYGDYQLGPPTPKSQMMLFLYKKRLET